MSTTTTSTVNLDPDIKAAYLGHLDYAQQVADALGTRQFAGFEPIYQEGEDLARGAATGIGSQNLGLAGDLSAVLGAYAPQQVGMDAAAVQSYMNPYTENVINRSIADLESARQGTVNQIGAQAEAAKAFGGSRHGLVESQANQDFAKQAGNLAADLRASGYQQALGAAQQAAIQNQAAGLQGAQLRGLMAGQLGDIGATQQQLGFQGAETLGGLGLARQALSQQQLDAARGLGQERLGVMSGALGLMGGPTSGAGTTATASQDRDMWDYLTGGAQILSLF